MTADLRRLKEVVSGATDEDVEATLENQLESMIQHCNDELGLIPRMAGKLTPPPPFLLTSLKDHTFEEICMLQTMQIEGSAIFSRGFMT